MPDPHAAANALIDRTVEDARGSLWPSTLGAETLARGVALHAKLEGHYGRELPYSAIASSLPKSAARPIASSWLGEAGRLYAALLHVSGGNAPAATALALWGAFFVAIVDNGGRPLGKRAAERVVARFCGR